MKGRMRTAGVTLALVGLLGTAGWLLLHSFSGPEFVAGALGRILGRPVEVASVRVRAGGTLRIELHELRILDAETREAMLHVDRVVARLGWPRLLAGHVLPTAWTLERPVLRLGGNGQAEAPAFPLRPVEVAVRDGTLIWGDPDDGGIRLTRIELSGRTSRLGGVLRGTAMSQIERAGQTIGSFSAEFDLDGDEVGARGSVTGLELSKLLLPGLPPLQGRASGTIAVRMTPEKRTATLELEVDGFLLDDPALGAPIAPEETRVVVDLQHDERAWRVGLRPLQLDDLIVRGSIRIDHDPGGRVSVDLSVDPFRPGLPGKRLQLLRLIGLRHASWARTDARTEAGIIEGLRMRLDVPRRLVADTLAFDRKPRPHELQIRARLRQGVYRRKPEGALLENIHAQVRVRGNRLEVYDVRMTRKGEALPEIDLTIDGLHRLVHLPKDERKTPEGPGVPIPGLGPAFEGLASGEDEDPDLKLELRDLRIGYPAFVFPIRDARARLSFPEGNLLVEEFEGVVGGAPARLSALWDRGQSRVTVDLTYLDGEAPPARAARPDDPWFEASFSRPNVGLDPWKLTDLHGRARALGARLDIPRLEARLGEGPFDANGTVDLGQAGRAPVEFRFQVEEANATEVAGMITLPPETLTGTLAAHGSLVGRLEPGVPFTEHADIVVELLIRDGRLGNLPLTVTIARLATPLGWSGLFGSPLRFTTIESSLRIEQGRLDVDSFSVQGPELRMLAAGQMELLDSELPVDLLVALLLFEPVDRIVGTVPVIGDWMLGTNKSLVGLYFQLEGPWKNPKGRYVPPQTLRKASGWAARMIVGGVRRIRDLVLPGAKAKP